MSTGKLYRTAIEYQISGQLNVNVMYLRQTAVDTRNAADVAEDQAAIWRGIYGNVLSTFSRAPNIMVRCTEVSRVFSDAGEFSTALVGSPGVVQTLPPANALVIRLKSGLADRTRRGRIFVGGICADRVAEGMLNPSGVLLYSAMALAIKANFVGNAPVTGFQLGVFSRERYKILSSPFDDYWVPVIDVQHTSAIATMRSRKVGVGS